MSSLSISLIAFVCVFGSALAGMSVSPRLPAEHLSEGSRDTVKLITGLMATLAALILGLLTASAKDSYDRVNEEFRQIASKAVLLDRALAEYGPETAEVRALHLRALKSRVDQLFPSAGAQDKPVATHGHPLQIESIEAQLRALLPAGDAKRAHLERALQLVNELANSGWALTIDQSDSALPAPMLIVLIAWLAAMFLGFGLLAPRNATVLVALLVGAMSVSASIFLIEEMTRPLDGTIHVSVTPLQNAIEFLGR